MTDQPETRTDPAFRRNTIIFIAAAVAAMLFFGTLFGVFIEWCFS